MADEHLKRRFRVTGMDCAACAAKIDNAMRKIDGVADVAVSSTAGTMVLNYAPRTDLAEVEIRVKALGYGIQQGDAPVPKAAARDHAGHDHRDRDHDHDHNHGGHDHDHHEPNGLHLHGHDEEDESQPWWRRQKTYLMAFAGVAFVVAFAASRVWPAYSEWAFGIAALVGLVPIARRAVMGALLSSPFSIETLLTIAAVGAVFIGAAEEASAVVFLFLVGEMLEGVAAGRARNSIKALRKLVPTTALLQEGGKTREVPAESLKLDDTILVRPGDRIPADGEIITGTSAIDEASVTGESAPVRKGTGDKVFAGTINTDAVITLKVTATAADNTIARVVALVEEAQESKAPTERFIDRFSRYYTPVVLLIGALVAVVPPLLHFGPWEEWIYKGLAVLLIGCPCALVISTPAAIAAALSAGARRGLLMKGGVVLETMAKVNAVALDKTGTLTSGKPQVTDIVPVGQLDDKAVMGIAAALETGSNHPLALAINVKARELVVSVPAAQHIVAVAGKGIMGAVEGDEVFLGSPKAASEHAPLAAELLAKVESFNGEGKTVSVLLVGGAPAALVAMRDEPRADAKAALAEMRELGMSTVMLTGDNHRTAEAVGRSLGIDVKAEMLPADKQKAVRQLQSGGKTVAKVGDGINDAPALAAAHVGIAMGGGTDVALETAGAAILHGRVADIVGMVKLARATMSNIRQNIAIALGLKGFFLVTTLVGVTGLWPAILADTGATVLVTANAMRLLGWKGRQTP